MAEENVFSGEDASQAIEAGLAALGLTREQVEIEVLDEGSRGVFGIGSRPASVRLTVIAVPEPVTPPAPPEAEPEPEPVLEPEPEQDKAEQAALGVLNELLGMMGFAVDVQANHIPPASADEDETLLLNVRGEDVDSLIGRKGETLAALQRIVRLVVRQQHGQWVNLVLDVDGYKQRREQNLRRLAERMAEKAIKSGRRIALEPMPAYERRIIHISLRNRSDVRTESEGMGHRRRVVIIP